MQHGRCDGEAERRAAPRNESAQPKRHRRRGTMQAANLEARMSNPVMVVPDALQPLLDLAEATRKAGLPPNTADLVHLRAAQINGCGYCVDMHARDLKEAGETDERLFAGAAWRGGRALRRPARAGRARRPP